MNDFGTVVETERLLVRPLPYDELIRHIKSPALFAEEIGLQPSSALMDEETQEAILNDLLPHLCNEEKNPLFYTMWIIIEKSCKSIIGGICFHGEPDENGEAEIGYGIDLEYQNKGYMTELIPAFLKWISTNNTIKSIKAETENTNYASLRVLQKTGFQMISQDESLITMRYKLG